MFASIHVPDFSVQAQGRQLPESSAYAALLDCASAFSPRVEDTTAGTVVLDVGGLDRLFGSLEELAQNILRHLLEMGLSGNVAISSNPDAAVCAAKGWSGITVIERGTEAGRLKDLSIAILPIDDETYCTLDRWGIHTFGALARLPVKALSERLGQHGVHLHRLACGIASRPLVPRKESLHFEESLELDYSITLLEPLTFILHRLCDSLFARLRSRGLAAQEIQLQLQRERPHPPFVTSLRLPLPAQNPRIVTKLFMLELDSHPPGGGIIGVRIEAIPSKPRVIQNGLFVPLSPEPEKLELTLARIAGVVGNGNVGSPELADSYARGRIFMRRFGSFASGKQTAQAQTALRLLRPALEATVRTRDGIPAWIAFSGVHGNIETASGPWQTSGDWWNAHSWNRSEWDIQIAPSPIPLLLRIFQDHLTRRWYAEGIYD